LQLAQQQTNNSAEEVETEKKQTRTTKTTKQKEKERGRIMKDRARVRGNSLWGRDPREGCAEFAAIPHANALTGAVCGAPRHDPREGRAERGVNNNDDDDDHP